jgi:class 3 adenylate cyclase
MSRPGAIAFTDIVGFTQFTAAEGDERAVELLDTKRRIVDQLLPADGRVVKELGDGLMMWVNEPDSTIRFCRDLQNAFRQASEDGPLPLWVRIGVHWGNPTQRAGDLIGHDVNTAARIVGQAGPGETLVSDVLLKQCDLAAAGVAAEPIGPVLMKGLPAAIWLYRLT